MKLTVIEKAMAALLLMASTTMAHYPISACEKTETTYVYGGNQYKICPGSDYQGTTLWAYHSIASQEACAQQCQQYQGCVRAVYDTVGGSCYMKDAPSALSWVADDQGLVTIRFDKSWPTSSAPTTCPFEVKTYTSAQGWQYTACPGSDYQGNTVSDTWGLKSDQECADACGKSASCFKAVYEPVAQVCRFKSSCSVQLVSNPYADTIMLVNRPYAPSCSSTTTSCTTTTAKSSMTTFLTTTRASTSTTVSTTSTRSKTSASSATTSKSTTSKSTTPASTTSKATTSASTTPVTTATTTLATTTTSTTTTATGVCANGAAPDSTYTASNGDVYGICKNTDFPGGDIGSPVYSITTIQACADACTLTAGCVAGNLHRDAQVCYLKGVQNSAVLDTAVDSAYLIKAGDKKSTSTTTTQTTTGDNKSTTTITTTAAATATGVCANGAAPDSTHTASNGDVYGICKNTDFPGGDIGSPVYSITTIQACADACTLTTGCIASNLNRDAQVCYLKGVQNGAVSSTGVDAAYLIKAGVQTSTSTTTTQSKTDNQSTTTTKTQTTGATTCQGATVTVTDTATVTKPTW